MAVPLLATTKVSVLRELVALAEQSWQVYDSAALLAAVRQREDLGSTTLASGVAIPHPRRPSPTMLGEPVIAYARTTVAIPFGGPNGVPATFSFSFVAANNVPISRYWPAFLE